MQKKVLLILVSLFLTSDLFSQTDYELAKKAFQQYKYNEVIKILSKNTKFKNLNKKKDKLEANYMLGKSYLIQENYSSAQKYLLIAKDIDDEHIKTLVSLGTVYAKQNQWQKSLKEFTTAEKEDKKNPDVPLARAFIYLDLDSIDKATEYFTKASVLNDQMPEIFIGLGDSYAEQNVYEYAIEKYNQAKVLDPKNPQILIKIGLAYTKLKKGKEAAQALKDAVDLDPSNTQVLLDLGKMYYKSGIYKEAAIYYQKYINLVPNDFEILNRYAKSLFKIKNYNEAIPVYSKLFSINPQIDYKRQIANCNYELENVQNAISVLSEIPLDSMNYKDFIKKGKAYLKLQDTLNAISNYRLAYTRDSLSSEVSGEMAAIFVAQKKFDESENEYNRILKNEPNNFSALFYGGFSSFMLEKFEDAKQKFKQVVVLRPEYLQGKMFLARMYQAQDSFAVAKEMFSKILLSLDTNKITDSVQIAKNNSSKTEIYNALAVIAYKSKNYLGAIDELKKAILLESKEIKKKNEGMHLFLAQMYNVSRVDKKMNSKTKDSMKKKAVDEYKFVLKINPNNLTAKKELDQLK
ncbi:MAG: tetratricopeptide repeat protein [Bacteroidetes bacterium]|nr:tetratricopeptide repeat protein [Bacteroidota bacterium]